VGNQSAKAKELRRLLPRMRTEADSKKWRKQRKGLFQLAREIEDLLKEQRLKRNLKGAGIRTRYIE